MSEYATDIELTFFLTKHIDNPCGILGTNNNIREAERILPTMENIDANQLLEKK